MTLGQLQLALDDIRDFEASSDEIEVVVGTPNPTTFVGIRRVYHSGVRSDVTFNLKEECVIILLGTGR